jgi:hypothetical protein
MLVVHPYDSTTEMLKAMYEGKNVQLITQADTNAAIKTVLNHLPRSRRLMMLGHGTDSGLIGKNADGTLRLIINHSHAYYLRKHGANIVAVWCYADLFARKEGLHGLFSGMIISEIEEAEMLGIPTTEEELARENVKLAQRLRMLLDEGVPLHEMPARMLLLDDVHSPLTTFNYRNFFYL